MTNTYNRAVSEHQGNIKIKKPNHKNMHPSVNYLKAKNVSSKLVRKGLRKWSVFWVRLNDGKITPKGTKKFAKKPKFDRKERDIWMDSREDKPTTRDDAAEAETVDESIDDTGN